MVTIGNDETQVGLIVTEIGNHSASTVRFHVILGILENLRKFPRIIRNFSFGAPPMGRCLWSEPQNEIF